MCEEGRKKAKFFSLLKWILNIYIREKQEEFSLCDIHEEKFTKGAAHKVRHTHKKGFFFLILILIFPSFKTPQKIMYMQ